MTEPAVAVFGLTKTFPFPFRRHVHVAVRDLSLRVEPGEIYGLLGLNGSGKSTTLKIILGLVSPTRGHVEIFGQRSDRVASRTAVGFLPESPYFNKHLTGAETLRFYGKLSGLRGSLLRDRVTELLEIVGLTSASARPLLAYSKGMLQRIGLAQALLSDPRLVVLDEPTAGVDPAGSREMRELILGLKARGTAILLTSHLLDQVEELCDRVGILADGTLVREGRIEDLLGVAAQSELVYADGPPELQDELAELVRRSGGRVVAKRQSRATLEKLFREATASPSRQNSDAS
jgi:ABC-2 type transport system ATP-binding protein